MEIDKALYMISTLLVSLKKNLKKKKEKNKEEEASGREAT
jgi:hypothetical protein